MARPKPVWETLAKFLVSSRLALLSLSAILLLVVYFQVAAIQRLSPKDQPFEGFGTMGEKEAQRMAMKAQSEARKFPVPEHCPNGPLDVSPEVIFSAREWLKPWSSDIQTRPERRITKRMIDELFAELEKDGFAVARIRVTGGVLAKPILVNGRGKEGEGYMQRVARWFLLFDTLQRSYGLPDCLDIVVSAETKPLLPVGMRSLSRPPVFGYFAHQGFLDVPLPSFELYGRLKRWRKHEVLTHSWLSRNPKVFWRGPPEGSVVEGEVNHWENHPSATLVRLSRQFPEVFDAKFVDCRAMGCSEALWESVYASELTSESNASYVNFLQHKFAVAMESSQLESTFTHMLSTMAVVLKAESSKKEFFEEFLVPFVHYVPLKAEGDGWEVVVAQLNKDVVQASEMSRAATLAFVEYVADDRWLEYAWAMVASYALLLQPK